MDKPLPRSRQPDEPDVADAEWLLQDSPPPEAPPARKTRRPARAPSRRSSSPTHPWPPGRVSPETLWPRGDRRPGLRSRMVTPSAPAVDQVWSRTAEWGPTLLVLLGWGAAVLSARLLRDGRRALRPGGADLRRRLPGGRPAQLSAAHHARAAREDHPRAGREGLLRRPLASSPPLPPDVAAAQRPGPGLSSVCLVRGIQELLGQAARASSARAMPDHSPRWSSRSRTSAPRRARGRPRSTRGSR